MDLDVVISRDLEWHSPFHNSLHSFRDFSNETGPPRILLNYSDILYIDQRTVHLNDNFLDEVHGAAKFVLELVENLGTFTVVDLSKITQRLFTFSYKLNKNTRNYLSSITFFFWVNRDLEDFTTLRGRFQGNFRLKSKRALEISSISDALQCMDFGECRDFGEIEDLNFDSVYPIFRNI